MGGGRHLWTTLHCTMGRPKKLFSLFGKAFQISKSTILFKTDNFASILVCYKKSMEHANVIVI